MFFPFMARDFGDLSSLPEKYRFAQRITPPICPPVSMVVDVALSVTVRRVGGMYLVVLNYCLDRFR